jgi:hypothetical protein
MGYREVSVVQVREILRLWVRGHRVRAIARRTQTDRKTVGRYIEAARAAGLTPNRGEGVITDDLIGAVVETVRPARAFARGRAWQSLEAQRAFLAERLDKGVPGIDEAPGKRASDVLGADDPDPHPHSSFCAIIVLSDNCRDRGPIPLSARPA